MSPETVLIALLIAGLLVAIAGTLYLSVLAVAGMGTPPATPTGEGRTRFAVLVPAHDEADGIGATVDSLVRMDYPRDRFEVYVVADHCSDETAARAAAHGAVTFERNDGPRSAKGAALAWLVQRLEERHATADAFLVFDADTRVERRFLRVMDGWFAHGARVVQGRHCIGNARDGTYPALADALMRIDNRISNHGRSRLGLSAKNMGDSIAFRTDAVAHLVRAHGLTEDHALRQQLLLAGIRIDYAPDAIGIGEAPVSWRIARRQRERWLRGTRASNAAQRRALLRAGVRQLNPLLLDGALQAYLPAYSTLVLVAICGTLGTLALQDAAPAWIGAGWLAVLAALGAYPLAGLWADAAPVSVYLALAAGPFFVMWRSVLTVATRIRGRDSTWERTPRRKP